MVIHSVKKERTQSLTPIQQIQASFSCVCAQIHDKLAQLSREDL